ncbi:MAG: NAD(P)-dependent oxidoreductase [Parvibaculum sp.]|uniref:NAD-dependent epimerase/dehydratase family protein n=1 Tax=Parvibaculum sp. TaxID=2024848 RepID=UPI0025FEEC1A|nr:NAD(P)-dependent oxidoreductase [Parvibaculum sp.]MCE9650278.1 NAD(P)-dependent oxidoreductase [Parvibaculum sp.]
MRILLTGASGFIGRHALAALLAAGHEVHAVSRAHPSVEGDYAWHGVDLLAPGQAAAIAGSVKPECVLHLAWCVEHGRFWTDPANAAWREATLALAGSAADAGARRFVGTGTCYEYDWPANANCDERATPVAAHTPYDTSKDECRRALDALARESGLSFAWARLFFLYGADEAPGRLVASVARAIARGEPAACSSGLVVRDFMDVRDAGAALAALALSDVEGPVNVASGEALSIAELVTRLVALAGRPDLIRLGALPDRAGEPPRIVAEVARLRDEVKFRPALSLDAGLRDALAFWASAEAQK